MKILVAVDGSDCSRRAIEFVASRKTLIKSHPKVQVINVRWPLPAHPARIVGMANVREYYADEAERALSLARRRLKKAGLTPLARYMVGRPAVEISAAAEKDKADLLVLGSHGHSALGGMLLGSVTNEVLVRTKRPTLVVRGKARTYADSLRVGIAVDGSAYGPAIVKYVLRHARLFGATPSFSLVHVVHTYDLVGMPSAAGIALPAFSPKEVQALQDKSFEAAMAPLRKLVRKQAGVTATEVRLVGRPGDELPWYANRKLDVLALGSHGYGAFKAVVLGSVATRVAAHCEIPLLLIRSAGRRSALEREP
jgi:nucleotide-binding universal stress UspA family protein